VLPQEAPQVNVVGGTVGPHYALAAGWYSVPCATGYRAELVGHDGQTISTKEVRRTSVAWDQVEISDNPAALRITPYNTQGDGQARQSSVSFIYHFF
jgi:hypothetical protein